MVEVMQLCGFRPGTQHVYLDAVKGLAEYHRRGPATLSREDVQKYLLYLIKERGLAHSTTNCRVAAFRFLYQRVLVLRCTPRERFRCIDSVHFV
jgi:site-specific recombinase XerD